MQVFISWSGDLSRELGEALRCWLPMVLQDVTPFFAPEIEKGARWSEAIATQLDACEAGVFCLTEQNLANPWIVFEAGALSRHGGRVCPILFGVDPAALAGPIGQFQAASFSEAEMRQLVGTLNSLSPNKLADQVLERVFDKWWPDLNGPVQRILERHAGKSSTEKPRGAGQRVEEILNLARLKVPLPDFQSSMKNDPARLMLVVCELGGAGGSGIEDYLARFPFWKLLDDAWLVRTSDSVEAVRDGLAQLIDEKDSVFVAELDGMWASINFPGGGWLLQGHSGAVQAAVRPVSRAT